MDIFLPESIDWISPEYTDWFGLTLLNGLTTCPSKTSSPIAMSKSIVPFDNILTFSAARQVPEDDPLVPNVYSTSKPNSNVDDSPSKLLNKIHLVHWYF